jgi:hypothetical protein
VNIDIKEKMTDTKLMKSQTPAEGILKKNDWGDAKMYHVVCDCGQSDHEHSLWVEADETGVSITIYVTVKSPWWSMNRFKQLWILLTKGYLKHETVLTMNEQAAFNYAETLKSAVKDVKTFRSKNDPITKAASKIANEGDCV